MPDPSTLSTAELRRAIASHGVSTARIARCLERPDFEELYREVQATAAATPKADPKVEEPTAQAGASGSGGVASWQSLAVIAFGLYFLFGSGGGGGGGGGDEARHGPAETAHITGHVAEIATLPDLKAVMSLHRDGTGLPVVLDFYSPYCGPCRMIAPKLTALAAEYKGRAAFIKVDVNSAYEIGSHYSVRAMPTFHFYLHGSLAHSFQGADTRSLQSMTAQLARKAESSGTYVKREVTSSSLRAFYATHDASKLSEVDDLISKYGANRTAKLMRILQSKYKATPQTSEVAEAEPPERPPPTAPPPGSATPGGGGSAALGSATVAELRAELQKRSEDAAAAAEAAEAAEAEGEARGGGKPPRTSASEPASVVILGAGPAGLSAAIYAARAGLAPFVVAPGGGGQLEGKGVEVENFPGVVGASGPSLVSLMRAQASGFNATIVSDVATAVDTSVRPFRVSLNGTTLPLHTRALIVALGAESKW